MYSWHKCDLTKIDFKWGIFYLSLFLNFVIIYWTGSVFGLNPTFDNDSSFVKISNSVKKGLGLKSALNSDQLFL